MSTLIPAPYDSAYHSREQQTYFDGKNRDLPIQLGFMLRKIFDKRVTIFDIQWLINFADHMEQYIQ